MKIDFHKVMLATNMEYKMKIDFTRYIKPKPYVEETKEEKGDDEEPSAVVEEEKKNDPEHPVA